MVADPTLTVTVATGAAMIVMRLDPVLPSEAAEIVAEPGATPVTSPDALTVAVVVLDDDHVTVRFDSTFPDASRVVADSWVVCPMTTAPCGVETSTVATAGGPDESPPHPAVKASAQTAANARLRRLLGIGFLRRQAATGGRASGASQRRERPSKVEASARESKPDAVKGRCITAVARWTRGEPSNECATDRRGA